MTELNLNRTKALLDNSLIVDVTGDNTGDPETVIVETFTTGPMVVKRSRIRPIA